MRALLLLAAAVAGAWSQEGGGTVEGNVTSAATHAPLANARVRVSAVASERKSEWTVVTGGDGTYRVEGVLPGNYTVSFSADGYAGSTSSAVRVPAGLVRVNAELWPASSVSGRVRGEDGGPAAGVAVELYRFRRVQPAKTVTDGEGRFAFANVAAGGYAVCARPVSRPKEGEAIAPTWFPGFIERAQAERVIVRSGAEVSGIEIRLRRTPVWSVQGAAMDAEGNPLGGVAVKLLPADEWQPEEAATMTGSGGSFRFEGVRPGQWRLAASGGGREGYAGVEVEKRDVERVALRLFPPFTLEGVVERDEPRNQEGKRPVSGVALEPQGGEGKRALAFHEQDGTIRFPKVQPGRYLIFPLGFIPGYYLESVKLGDREVLTVPVDLTGGALPFRVIYKPNAGRVRGTVENGAGLTVVVLPQDEKLLDGQFIRTAKCDASGRFEVFSLKPGDYYAFAFDQYEMDALEDISFVRTILSLAALVRVESGKSSDVELKVARWPEQ